MQYIESPFDWVEFYKPTEKELGTEEDSGDCWVIFFPWGSIEIRFYTFAEWLSRLMLDWHFGVYPEYGEIYLGLVMFWRRSSSSYKICTPTFNASLYLIKA
jgi:hypothetical protein